MIANNLSVSNQLGYGPLLFDTDTFIKHIKYSARRTSYVLYILSTSIRRDFNDGDRRN